ncbi:MAG: glutamyl-tRNA amidotransferase [Chloroflexota bacterium]
MIQPQVGPIHLAVNGTLMRGLALNKNLLDVGAQFVREAKTAPIYRLWTINDVHPAMIRNAKGGAEISLEIWALSAEAIATVLMQEPPGLCVGRLSLSDSREVLGVLGEPFLCEDQLEITQFGGWREYMASL